MSRDAIEIPGDWGGRDRFLYALARKTGFKTVNRLLTHVANELSACKTPAEFYHACSLFHDARKNKNRSKK